MADRRTAVKRYANQAKALLALLLVAVVVWGTLRGCDPAVPSLDDRPAANAPSSSETETRAVTIAGRTFDLELATTRAARYQGLSDRASIPEDGGMLFVFPDEAERSFVMRRCLVPIDLIYLDAEGRVLNTHQMTVEPYDRPEWQLTSYRSDGKAQYVIELRGGTLDELDLSRGDRVDLPTGLKPRAR